MAAQSNQNDPLGIMAIMQGSQPEHPAQHPLANSGYALSQQDLGVINNLAHHVIMNDAVGYETQYAGRTVADMYVANEQIISDSVVGLHAIRDQAVGEEHKAIMTEVTRVYRGELVRAEATLLKVGEKKILDTQAMTLEPPPPPPPEPPLSGWEKMFGRRRPLR